jgi:glycosyltransferase involved in cell wall biosynthesis
MSTSPIKVYLVIPAYNEGKNIETVLSSILPFYQEVVVVDDGSLDNTAELVGKFKVKLLRHATNRGQGAALRTGTKYAFISGADIVVHFDADGQFLVSDINKFIDACVSGADIVFGSRFLEQTTQMPWFKEQIIMPLARLVNSLFFGIKLTDPQSGFRAFKREAFAKILWQQDGMAHCTEILHRASAAGLVVREVPITVIYHDFGQKLSGGFRILKDFFIYSLINK